MLSDLAAAARVAFRSGLLTPVLPRASLLALAARAPFRAVNLGVGVELQAALRPHEVALVDDTGSLTWGELAERVRSLAHVLLERVGEGGRTAFLVRNSRQAVECYAAAGMAGTVAVPVNTWTTPSELDYLVGVHRPGMVVVDAELAEVPAKAGISRADVLEVGGGYERALAAAPSDPPSVRGTGRIVTHTSGTTGRPKGAEREVGAGQLAVGLRFLDKVPLHRDHRFAIAAPLFHAFGQGMLAAGVSLGCTLLLQRRFEPRGFLQLMARHDAQAAALVPVMLRRLLEVTDVPPPSSWRLAVVSGSALPPPLRERARERFGDILYDLYGSTEAGFAAIATPEDAGNRPGTVGRPSRGMRVFTVSEEGRVLDPGEVGRIHVDAGMALERYSAGEPVPRGVDGAIDLGDLGYLDDDGYLFVTGRADDMVVSGGENIYPSEVEEALEAHPDVADAAVVGVSDAEYDEVLHAFVVARPGRTVTPEGLVGHLRERLARYKVPKRVEVVDVLPRNATGKVLKNELRKRAEDLGG